MDEIQTRLQEISSISSKLLSADSSGSEDRLKFLSIIFHISTEVLPSMYDQYVKPRLSKALPFFIALSIEADWIRPIYSIRGNCDLLWVTDLVRELSPEDAEGVERMHVLADELLMWSRIGQPDDKGFSSDL